MVSLSLIIISTTSIIPLIAICGMAGSPYHAKVVCARKVLVVGGWQHYMDSKERVSLIVNEEKQIPFDVSQAGPGVCL